MMPKHPPLALARQTPPATGSMRATAHPKKRAFLRAYSVCGVKTKAAKIAGVARRTVYLWEASDPEFVEQEKFAKLKANERLEAEAWRRAYHGHRKLATNRGEVIFVYKDANGRIVPKDHPSVADFEPLYEHAHSDVLTVALLKANMPEKYRDNMKIESETRHEHDIAITLDARRSAMAQLLGQLGQRG